MEENGIWQKPISERMDKKIKREHGSVITQNLYTVLQLHTMAGQKVTVRLSDAIQKGIEEYIKRHPEFFDKSSAIRSLIVKALKDEGINVGGDE